MQEYNSNVFYCVKLKSGKLIINKENIPYGIISFMLYYILFVRFAIQLGAPDSLIYILDIANVFLLSYVFRAHSFSKYFELSFIYAIIVILFSLVAVLNYSEWGGTVVHTIIEIRNIVRFPIFFVACCELINEQQMKQIFKNLVRFFFVNSCFILYQYITYHPAGVWMRGDHLNGFFGTDTGGNTFVNVLLIVVIVYLENEWKEKKISTVQFLIPVSFALIISALIELKVFFVEIVIIYFWYWISTRKSASDIIKNIFIISIALIAAGVGLQYMYQEYPWFRDSLSFSGIFSTITDASGYTGSGDLNRLTGLITIAINMFKQNIPEILMGIGLGNGASYEVFGNISQFYQLYESTHYTWFSATYIFVQCGLIGVLLNILIYIFILKRNKNNTNNKMITSIMSILTILLLFYGEALKTDAGYLVYFALAAGFVKQANTNNMKSYDKP